MIARSIYPQLREALHNVPVVALLGPRQVGKTTLAFFWAENSDKPSTYLDLELDSDYHKLSDPEAYLTRFHNELLIIDEVQRKPELFPILRGIVDRRKRKGESAGHFLLLGSASRDLLQHSSETLAGRIRYLELTPFMLSEVVNVDNVSAADQLWFRGGFPNSFLAESDQASWDWRSDFITTYLERDIPQLGINISAIKLRRFWTMLAHQHGQQVVLSTLARSMELSHTTIRHYLDMLTDFFMIRQLLPWSGNVKKRLVKSPKIYLRDTGILHRLLQISNYDALLGNPIVGASWEGFAVENILNRVNDRWTCTYYRSHTQIEVDLVMETPDGEIWAVEVKRGSVPKLSRGFHQACADIKAHKKWVVYSGNARYPLPHDVEVIGLTEFLGFLT